VSESSPAGLEGLQPESDSAPRQLDRPALQVLGQDLVRLTSRVYRAASADLGRQPALLEPAHELWQAAEYAVPKTLGLSSSFSGGDRLLVEVSVEDLERLRDEGIEESLFLEYKSEWSGSQMAKAIAEFERLSKF
jgi:hypothetical protein